MLRLGAADARAHQRADLHTIRSRGRNGRASRADRRARRPRIAPRQRGCGAVQVSRGWKVQGERWDGRRVGSGAKGAHRSTRKESFCASSSTSPCSSARVGKKSYVAEHAKTDLRCALSTARASSTTTSPRRPAAEGRRARQQVATRGREAPRPRRERQRGEASPKERRIGVAAPRRTGAEESVTRVQNSRYIYFI